MAWRSQEAEQQKLEVEQSAIELKQREHLDTYRKQRAELAHLSWRSRKSFLYRLNRNTFTARESEKTERDGNCLPLVIKGQRSCWDVTCVHVKMCASLRVYLCAAMNVIDHTDNKNWLTRKCFFLIVDI